MRKLSQEEQMERGDELRDRAKEAKYEAKYAESVAQLRLQAKDHKIKGYSKMNKQQLIDALAQEDRKAYASALWSGSKTASVKRVVKALTSVSKSEARVIRKQLREMGRGDLASVDIRVGGVHKSPTANAKLYKFAGAEV